MKRKQRWTPDAAALLAVLVVLSPVWAASAGAAEQATALGAPRLYVLKRSPNDAPGYIFLAPKEGQGRHGPEIVDDRGRPIWFHPVAGIATDFRVQQYRGNPVLTWWQGIGIGSGEPGVDYIADSSYHVIATVHAGNGLDADGHEFVLTPQGTALVTAYRSVPYDLSSLGGPKDITRIYVERMLAPHGIKPGEFDMVFAGATAARAQALLGGAVGLGWDLRDWPRCGGGVGAGWLR